MAITALGNLIRKHTLSAENENGITINIDTNGDDGVVATAAEISEIEADTQLDEIAADQVDEMTTAAESALADVRRYQRNSAGFSPDVGAMMVKHMSLIGRGLGLRYAKEFATMPTAESANFSTPSKVPHQLHLMAEFAGDLVRKGWEWLKRKFKEYMEKIALTWNKYGSGAARYKRAADSLKERVSSGNFGKKEGGNAITNGALAKKLDGGVNNKIDAAALVKSMLTLHSQVSAVRESYIAAMGDANFEKAVSFLDAEQNAADINPGGTAGAATPSPADEAKETFSKWVETMTTGLVSFMVDADSAAMVKLGRSQSDADAFTWKISNEANVIPGNRAFILRERKSSGVAGAPATTNIDQMEATTLRCMQYNVKSNRTDSFGDQLPILTQAQMGDLAMACSKASEELITLANTVTKGKGKRDRLKKAIDRAADLAAKADAGEEKAYTAARKLGTIMMQQIDNPASDFQSAALQAIGATIEYIKASISAYSA